jgi:hypothetical protein
LGKAAGGVDVFVSPLAQAVANPEILKGGADFFFSLFFLSFFLIFSSPK